MSTKQHHIEFSPNVCKPRLVKVKEKNEDGQEYEREEEQPAAWSGTITLRAPAWSERLDLFESFGINLDAIAEGDDTESAKLEKRGASLMRHAAMRAEPFVVKIALTRAEDGYVVTTWDELIHDTTLGSVMTEIGSRIIGRYSVGKTSTPS